jgi:hypothetical protein
MGEFWRKAEQCWNRNGVVAGVLLVAGIGFALWAAMCPQSPGISIGLLAAAAGIMSVRPKMQLAEKLSWVVILVTLTVLEVLAIGRNDKATEAIRDAQNLAFKGIADGLNESMTASKGQYKSTIEHVDGVLKTTQAVSSLARENLENLTGGDSYAFVYPDNIIDEGSDPAHCRFVLKIHNDGKQILTGVTVKVTRILISAPEKGFYFPGQPASVPDLTPIEIGTLAPHTGRVMPGPPWTPTLRPDQTGAYLLRITSQNGGFSELLYFKPSKDNRCLAYKFRVTSRAFGQRKAGDFPFEGEWLRNVKTRDWTEPTYTLPMPH